MRRQRREDPAYLTAMREAKELFDAEMAKNSMKGRGRPKTVVVAAPAAATEIEIDHEATDEIADLAGDDVEADELDGEGEEAAPPTTAKVAKPAKPAVKSAAKSARSSSKSSATTATRAAKKPAAKKKAAPARKPAKRR